MGCTKEEVFKTLIDQNPNLHGEINQSQVSAQLKSMQKTQVIKSVKGNQPRRKNILMLKDLEPNQKVKGDLGGNANPEALKNIEIIMNKVFEFVSRQKDVTDIDILSFMR